MDPENKPVEAVHTESTVTLILPVEVRQLVSDLHNDRQFIGIGAACLIGAYCATALARILRKGE
jgi:hypothetical protein